MSATKSPAKQAKERRERFTTASGLPLERLYSEESLRAGMRRKALGYPENSVHARIYPFDVSRAVVDHAAVRGVRVGGGIQPSVTGIC